MRVLDIIGTSDPLDEPRRLLLSDHPPKPVHNNLSGEFFFISASYGECPVLPTTRRGRLRVEMGEKET
jgi:hypothetical protein